MRFSTEWIDHGPNASAEERATLCRFRLYVSEENACRFFDPSSDSACDHVTVPAVHLAEGLATDWWSLFGGRDREHPIRNYRTGFAFPNVKLGFDGSTFEVRGEQFASENPDLRFWQVGGEGLPRDVAESTLVKFIEEVVRRLATAGVSNSEVALRWSRVSRSLNDLEERAFCEAAGALGIDPYGVSESDAKFIEKAADLFSGEALLEFLAGIGGEARGELLSWVREVDERPPAQSCLPQLRDIVGRFGRDGSRRPAERGWATGYRAAREFRDVTEIARDERFVSLSDIARRLGSESFACTPGIRGALALVCREENDVRIHVRERGSAHWARQAESFAFARAIGDVVCFGDARRSVVNSLHQAERQAAGRAFAAEFLAPVESVLDMVESGLDDDEIAGSFHVSPQVIARQIENRDRIREACTERPD
ncbi:MAG: ImmA/IrrE family metallo-endopeptidase [Chloroflexi bacterium]|nr:ImmA/IrrE family metallo-endopeptidase [Chloroflexota bacterium]